MRVFRFQVIVAILDWFAMVATYQVVSKWHLLLISPGIDVPLMRPEITFIMAYAAAGVILFHYNNLYAVHIIFSGWEQLSRLVKSALYLGGGLIAMSFTLKAPFVTESRFVVVVFTGAALVVTAILRAGILRTTMQFLARVNVYRRNILILGAGRIGRLLAANLTFDNPFGVRVLGFLDSLHSVGAPVFRGITVIGSLADIQRTYDDYDIDEIIVCVEETPSEEFVDILERCRRTGANVKIASPLYDLLPSMRFTERYGRIPLIGLSQPERGPAQEIYKRIFDLILAGVGVVVLSPAYLAIAIAIRLASPGPVLYSQTRIGKDGVPFHFYKFRSMLVGSDQDPERVRQMAELIRNKKPAEGSTKIVNESRVTSVGRFLLKTSLDELPQLFNVLKGDMSLVGPRPCLPYEWDHYEEWHKRRLSVIPGCTGVWQVSGRSAVGFDDMVILDLYYIQNTSLFLDLQLIFKTIPVMVFGRGGK
jgi:undecaprenyl-phosphate galactose phosphotransferase